LRRRINTAIDSAETRADKAQLVAMKRAYDNYIDEAVRDALFEGDQEAIAALKQSRELFSEYAKKFRAGKRDPAGSFIETIVEGNPTGEQVVNAMFASSGFGKNASVQMVRRIKEIVGEGEAWDSIRGEAFNRFVRTNSVNGADVVSGQQSLKALNEALKKDNTLMTELFSTQEISTMRRLFAHVQRTQAAPVRSRENPSGTAQALTKSITDLVRRLAGFGFGGVDLMLTSGGLEVAQGMRSATRAANSVRPFEHVVRPKPALVGAGTGAARE
jgi:hypothetical protein